MKVIKNFVTMQGLGISIKNMTRKKELGMSRHYLKKSVKNR